MNTPRSFGKRGAALLFFALLPFAACFAETEGITGEMTSLVIQLGLIIIAAHIGGRVAHRLGLPSVLGELGAGILLSHSLLGGIALPGFPAGLFPPAASGFAVSTELYGFATFASIILLFMSGLETDIGLFKRYAAAGLAVGLGGVAASFGLGALSGVIAFGWSWLDPRTLFLGILGTATSVGITARILSDQRKMDSPEGTTILAAAVIDDVLGIICLAIVLGISSVLASGSGSVNWGKIAGIAGKAFGIWAFFTVLGLVFAKRIARLLKVFRTPEAFAVLALGLALLLAGFFETEGLAMIIGAYIMGLSLSGTDLKFAIREKLQPLYMFLVPVFFAVMGMLVDLRELASPSVLAFGAIYTLIAFVSKIAGCALPSFFFGFNPLGALRIGVGMVPRGEVALIIAGIGISGGFLDKKLFGVVILMTLITTVIPPPLLKALLKREEAGTKKEGAKTETVSLEIPMGDPALTEMAIESMAGLLKREGFFVHFTDPESDLYVAAREDSRISLRAVGSGVCLESRASDAALAKAVAHETLVELEHAFKRASEGLGTKRLTQDIISASTGLEKTQDEAEGKKLIDASCVALGLHAKSREDAIRQLVKLLVKAQKVEREDEAVKDILEREAKGPTGLERGIAFPHGRSDAVAEPVAALGVFSEGIDFGAPDGQPAKVVVLLLSPKAGEVPHLRLMANLAQALTREGALDGLMLAHKPEEAAAVFVGARGGAFGKRR